MKTLVCLSLILLCANTVAHSQPEKTIAKLDVQTTQAEPAHLTTRIEWRKFPQIQFNDADLAGRNRIAIVRVKANESGQVTDASIKESTGLTKLDQKLINAVLKGQTKPLIRDGHELSMIGYQVFSLKLTQDDAFLCQFEFSSKNWQAQQNKEKVPFTYQEQPKITISAEDLNQHNRSVKFSFKVSKHGEVKSSKITQGSGIYRLDQQILAAVNQAQVDVPRKYWIYKKSKLKDEIQFNLDQCQ